MSPLPARDGAIVDVRALSKLHGARAALLDVSFAVGAGERLTVIGGPGAGKSTLLKLLAGHMAPSGGRIRICGLDARVSRLASMDRIGYVPQERLGCGDLRPLDLLEFSGRARHIPHHRLEQRIAEVADLCGLASALQTPYRELGKARRGRVALGQALLHAPEVLLLDEFLTDLDEETSLLATLLDRLRATTTVIVTGPPSLVDLWPASHTMHLQAGRAS